MNRYYEFFYNMSDEEWEKFAVEVLRCVGFQICTMPAYGTDGGKDFIVSNPAKFIVSCKHYIGSGNHVGQDDEKNISDRLLQFGVTGFIGFYSTGITTGLQNRLDAICKNGNYSYMIFDAQKIIQIMQYMDTKVLQSYGLYPHKYYMNVSEDEYKPLKCMICGRDILTDENIPNSLVGVAQYKDGTYEYAYGCKPCFINIKLHYNAHLEMEQALHLRQLQGWEDMVDEWIKDDKLLLNEKFYTDGNWYGIDF